VVDLTLRVDMLAWPNDHAVGRRHVDKRWLPGIGVRDPEGYGESVSGASERDWHCSGKVEEQSGCSIIGG